MQSQPITRSSEFRRARTLAGSLAVLLAGAALYAKNVEASPCGIQADFLAAPNTPLASVRPADCARLYGSADFAWPAARERGEFTVSLTFPDGSVQTRTTATDWLAWDAPLPAGRYTWTVTSAAGTTSQPRQFTVDATATAFVAPAAGLSQDAAASAAASLSTDSHGISTHAATAPALEAAREAAGAEALAPAASAWTSFGGAA